MDDLTSKRALLEKIADLVPYCGHCDGYGFVQLDCVEDAVKEAPTVDAVPVVRCKDCKHFSPCEEIIGVTWTGYCNYGEFHTDEEDFCSRGERKENETN